MKRTRQARRDAKHLYRLCVVNGLLDEARVHQVVQRISASRTRTRLPILAQLRRLVKLDIDRRTARVESAEPLPPRDPVRHPEPTYRTCTVRG